MAKTDPLKKSTRESIAEQLGPMMSPSAARLTAASPTARAIAHPELGESLAVCLLTAEQVRNPPADLAAIATPTGMWHHQVHTGAGATFVARSQAGGLGGDEHQVTQMFESPIAAKIDEAITWLDRKLGNKPATVRLLVAPAYYVHALLIIRGKNYSALVADQPASFKQLEPGTIYPLAEFLAKLSTEQASVGISGLAATAPLAAMMEAMPAAVAPPMMPEPKSLADLDVLMRQVTPTTRDLEQQVIDAVTGPASKENLTALKAKTVSAAVTALNRAGGREMVSSAIEGSGDFGGLGWRIYKRLHTVRWDVKGEFHGPSTVTWKAARDYIFRPDTANPFYFVRNNGQRIEPRAMSTDGGSIPRVVWSVPNMDPWSYLPAYLLHDWLFMAHHCVPGEAGSFDDANIILAEAIYTMMMTGQVPGDWRNVEIIFQAVSSFVGRRVWNRTWTGAECDGTLNPTTL